MHSADAEATRGAVVAGDEKEYAPAPRLPAKRAQKDGVGFPVISAVDHAISASGPSQRNGWIGRA